MQPTSRKFLLALPVSLLFSSICFAQTAAIKARREGLKTENLWWGASKIERTDIKQSFATKTDKKGHYFYGGLGIAGTFNISIEVAGKLVDQVNGVKPQGGVPQEVNFDLRPLRQ